ncbi:MAG: hypothetical protein ATN34_03145 [Epulopiscium sp. Nele67-Bin002]|nr:MAG: hypothetical protein ATN34_03145 [Epulopiscium sp. Nele67-Bin002]
MTSVLMCLMVAAFFIQNFLLLKFISKMFYIKGDIVSIIILSATSAGINLVLRFVFITSSPVAYMALTLFHFFQVALFVETDILTKITFGLMTPIHLMANSFIINSIVALVTKYTYYDLFNDTNLFMMVRTSNAITLALLIYLLSKVFGLKYFDELKKYPQRMKICVMLEILVVTNLLGASSMFVSLEFSYTVIIHMLVVAISMLGFFYLGMFMLVGFKMLDDYKIYTHSKLLENMYRNLLIEKSERTIEIDCRSGRVLNYMYKGEAKKAFVGQHYESLLQDIMHGKIHPAEKDSFVSKHKLSYMSILCSDDITSFYECEYRLQSDDGSYTWYKDLISVYREGNSNNIKAVMVTNNIQSSKNLEISATVDGLSGLYNKSTTEVLINAHLQEYKWGVLFMIDVDNFKSINDNFGHDIGDEVIKEVAAKLTYIFKPEDIIGRMGGDEFMVFVTSLGNVDINDRANQICDSIRKTYSINDISVTISASIGICEVSEFICSFVDLYKIADTALYESKSRGKNTYTIRQI